MDLVAVPQSFQEDHRHRSLGVEEVVVLHNHLDMRDHTGSSIGGSSIGGSSTVISILSDAV